LGGAIGRGVSNIATKIRGAPAALREFAEESAAKVGNPMLKGYRIQGDDGIREMGRQLLDEKLVRFGDTAEKAAERIAPARQAAGRQVRGD
jgi:hypothetical protein